MNYHTTINGNQREVKSQNPVYWIGVTPHVPVEDLNFNIELFAAFSYTGSPKTEQGGDNQARHVVLTLESGISLPEALFPVKKSQKSQKSQKVGTES